MILSRSLFIAALAFSVMTFAAHAQDESAPTTDAAAVQPLQPQDQATYATGPSKPVTAGTPQALTPQQQALCPDTETMRKAAPGDISSVQADIERLNLCVERAKLLQQLDTVILARQKALEKMTNPDVTPNGGISTNLSGIPPLPIGSLPPVPRAKGGIDIPKDLKPGEVRIKGTAGNAFDTAAAPVAQWHIRKIWGQGAGMRAQIVDGNTILNVVQGDPLPDGGTVETVSVKGVTVSRNGKINDLSWETSDSPSSSASSANVKVIP